MYEIKKNFFLFDISKQQSMDNKIQIKNQEGGTINISTKKIKRCLNTECNGKLNDDLTCPLCGKTYNAYQKTIIPISIKNIGDVITLVVKKQRKNIIRDTDDIVHITKSFIESDIYFLNNSKYQNQCIRNVFNLLNSDIFVDMKNNIFCNDIYIPYVDEKCKFYLNPEIDPSKKNTFNVFAESVASLNDKSLLEITKQVVDQNSDLYNSIYINSVKGNSFDLKNKLNIQKHHDNIYSPVGLLDNFDEFQTNTRKVLNTRFDKNNKVIEKGHLINSTLFYLNLPIKNLLPHELLLIKKHLYDYTSTKFKKFVDQTRTGTGFTQDETFYLNAFGHKQIRSFKYDFINSNNQFVDGKLNENFKYLSTVHATIIKRKTMKINSIKDKNDRQKASNKFFNDCNEMHINSNIYEYKFLYKIIYECINFTTGILNFNDLLNLLNSFGIDYISYNKLLKYKGNVFLLFLHKLYKFVELQEIQGCISQNSKESSKESSKLIFQTNLAGIFENPHVLDKIFSFEHVDDMTYYILYVYKLLIESKSSELKTNDFSINLINDHSFAQQNFKLFNDILRKLFDVSYFSSLSFNKVTNFEFKIMSDIAMVKIFDLALETKYINFDYDCGRLDGLGLTEEQKAEQKTEHKYLDSISKKYEYFNGIKNTNINTNDIVIFSNIKNKIENRLAIALNNSIDDYKQIVNSRFVLSNGFYFYEKIKMFCEHVYKLNIGDTQNMVNDSNCNICNEYIDLNNSLNEDITYTSIYNQEISKNDSLQLHIQIMYSELGIVIEEEYIIDMINQISVICKHNVDMCKNRMSDIYKYCGIFYSNFLKNISIDDTYRTIEQQHKEEYQLKKNIINIVYRNLKDNLKLKTYGLTKRSKRNDSEINKGYLKRAEFKNLIIPVFKRTLNEFESKIKTIELKYQEVEEEVEEVEENFIFIKSINEKEPKIIKILDAKDQNLDRDQDQEYMQPYVYNNSDTFKKEINTDFNFKIKQFISQIERKSELSSSRKKKGQELENVQDLQKFFEFDLEKFVYLSKNQSNFYPQHLASPSHYVTNTYPKLLMNSYNFSFINNIIQYVDLYFLNGNIDCSSEYNETSGELLHV